MVQSCTEKTTDGYKLVWEENFEGETIDTTIWNFEDNARGGGNAELQYYTPKNATIGIAPTGEKCLVISAIKENYKNRPATSARLNTQDKVMVTYGKIEARICFPFTKDGLWPAFWMLGNDLVNDLGDSDAIDSKKDSLEAIGKVIWPKCGEIDICEMGHVNGIKNNVQDKYFNGACHWGEDFNGGQYPNLGKFTTTEEPVQGDFHLFTVVWTKDSIAMYLDQDKNPETEPYFELSLRDKDVNEPGHYFCKPFYLLLNLSVGGFFPDMPSPDKFAKVIDENCESFQKVTGLPKDGTPVNMYVDYIRIYQRGEEGEQLITNKK